MRDVRQLRRVESILSQELLTTVAMISGVPSPSVRAAQRLKRSFPAFPECTHSECGLLVELRSVDLACACGLSGHASSSRMDTTRVWTTVSRVRSRSQGLNSNFHPERLLPDGRRVPGSTFWVGSARLVALVESSSP